MSFAYFTKLGVEIAAIYAGNIVPGAPLIFTIPPNSSTVVIPVKNSDDEEYTVAGPAGDDILTEDININEIFYNSIQKLNNFFISSDDVKKQLNKNQDIINKKKNKTILVEKYLLQMSSLYNNLFINSKTESGKMGFVYDLNTLDINLDELKTISISEVDKIGKVTISKFSDLGIENKSSSLLPIVENQLGDIILIQKYYMNYEKYKK